MGLIEWTSNVKTKAYLTMYLTQSRDDEGLYVLRIMNINVNCTRGWQSLHYIHLAYTWPIFL